MHDDGPNELWSPRSNKREHADLLTIPSSVPRSLSYAGSQNHLKEENLVSVVESRPAEFAYGSFTRTRPCIETRAWRRDDLAGLQDSFLSPAQVPRMDKHTFPSSYKFLDRRLSRLIEPSIQDQEHARIDTSIAVRPTQEVGNRRALREI